MRLTLPLSAVVTDTVLNNPAQQVEKKPVVKLFLTPPKKEKKKINGNQRTLWVS